MTLVSQGVFKDGCEVALEGTIRVKDGETWLESSHNLIAVDGKIFSDLCAPNGGRTEQGQFITQKESGGRQMRHKELEKEKASLENDILELRQKFATLQEQFAQEQASNTSLKGQLSSEQRQTKKATQTLADVRAKLAEKVAHAEELKSQLSAMHQLQQSVSALQEQLLQETSRYESLEAELSNERRRTQKLTDTKAKLEEAAVQRETQLSDLQQTISSLQERLSQQERAYALLEAQLEEEHQLSLAKSQKIQESDVLLAEKISKADELKSQVDLALVMQKEAKEKLCKIQHERIELQQSFRFEDVLILSGGAQRAPRVEGDITDLRDKVEELDIVKKELSDCRTLISTLKNELEIAELEEREHQSILESKYKENELLRRDLDTATKPTYTESDKLRRRNSLRKQKSWRKMFLENIKAKKPVEGEAKKASGEKKEKGEKEKREKKMSDGGLKGTHDLAIPWP